MTALIGDHKSLVDTNVVVYAYDIDDPRKQQIAVDLLSLLSSKSMLVFSVQVFNEISSVMMQKRRSSPLPPSKVHEILRELAATGEVLPMTSEMTFSALEAMQRHGFSFWDALIWASAMENGVSVIYTEDFQHGRDIEGVQIVNPFVEEPVNPAGSEV